MIDLLTSQIFITLGVSWILAHLIKILVRKLRHRDNIKLFEPGGFPSGHTTLVMTLVFSFVYEFGWDSNFVVLSSVLAAIVIYDSLNLRFEAEKHARALIDLDEKEKFLKYNLKRNLGHTKVEVIAGVLLAIIVTIISYEIF